MAAYIIKVTRSGGQYRVTLPKDLVRVLGLEKVRVVEIWEGEDDTIMMKEYHGKKNRERRL